jgi:alkanesulfonate monooxygenase SsuD/methylene tetrahydromethanopterin reductase-like flavin-dependent oxidoreductase (luciferase family)
MQAMKLGFFTMPMHPLDKDWRLSLKEDREAFLLADELGFSEAYVGEHTTDKAENITSCIAFMAWIAAATRQIKLGTGTINMPNTHPAALAASLAMLDHMLDGRLIFGISPGGLLSDAEAFGNLDANRNEMFLEAINQVLEIWAGEAPYNIKGKYWNISTERHLIEDIGQGYIARPLQRPHPPIVVTAVAPFSKGVTEAAARGWDPISANFLMPAWVKSHWPKYVEGCERGGRAADAGNWRVAKSVFVARDAAKAKAYATDPDGPYVNYYRSLYTKLKKNGRIELFKTRRDQPDDEVTLEMICDRLIIYGTPDSVADQLLAFQDEIGTFGTLLYAGKDWKDRELGRESMILMAEKVMPQVNAGILKQSNAAE